MLKRREKPHGIMFHHFYNEKHYKGQGSISADQLESIIDYYGSDILPAEEWFGKAMDDSLENNDVCLTFDDSLLCQYEIALPVLEKHHITAFWFIYSSVMDGGVGMFEVYKKFRAVYFTDIEAFYEKFFLSVKKSVYNDNVELSLKNYSHENYKDCGFFSKNDTKFRYIRSVVLGPEKYGDIMNMIMKDYRVSINEFVSDLWMGKEHVKRLDSCGHIIGLHSYTHPMNISRIAACEQKKEYQTNYDFLYQLLGKKPTTVSYPYNLYNEQTLSILNDLGVKVGFRDNMGDGDYSKLEFAREDHANAIRMIRKLK